MSQEGERGGQKPDIEKHHTTDVGDAGTHSLEASGSNVSRTSTDKKLTSDELAKVLFKVKRNKPTDSILENDSIFLSENKKVSTSKKESKSSNKVKKGDLLKPLDMKLNLKESNPNFTMYSGTDDSSGQGFSVRIQRMGEHTNGTELDVGKSKMVPPGFFTTASLSFVNSCNGFLKRAHLHDDQKHSRDSNSSLAKADFKHASSKESDVKDSQLNHSSNNVPPKDIEELRTADFILNKTENVSTSKSFTGYLDEIPYFPEPGNWNHGLSPTKDVPKDHNTSKPVWSNEPKLRLRKKRNLTKQEINTDPLLASSTIKNAARKHLNLIIANTSADSKDCSNLHRRKSQSQTGNFVKLNLNGKGSKTRKFVNKGAKRKAGSSFQSYRNRKRIKTKLGKLHDESEENGDMHSTDYAYEHGKGNNEKETQSSENEKRSMVNLNKHSRKCSEGTKTCETHNYCDMELLRKATEDVLEEPSDDRLLRLLNITHGFDSFRPGQLETIKRILALQSTMLVSPTGSGKSLCYQLPALIFPGVTLVISPLVALMIDQLHHLPPLISGALLSSSQTGKEVAEIFEKLRRGDLKVLYISPERLLSESFLSTVESIPRISFVVVDEAHCLSEWSHNFRPSYFRLGAVFRKKLNVKCILAMTATATWKTLQSISHALHIPLNDVVKVTSLRENIQLSVSTCENKLKDLLSLMKSPPFLGAHSIIVYCKFQSETEMVSKFLRDNNIHAKSYHGGLSAKDRCCVQDMFCHNRLQVVVATVAFGMGLDKKDVDAVIHYSLPGSLEQYVQETGRAGRDGRVAYCHLFLDNETYFKARSLAYSDGADEYAVNKFLGEIFASQNVNASHLCFLKIESASKRFDLKEEVMATILSYLEMERTQYLHVVSQSHTTCMLSFHKSSPLLLSKKNTFIENILKRSQSKHGCYVFDLPTIANHMSVGMGFVLNELDKLKFMGEVVYELKDPAYVYVIYEAPEDICLLTKDITAWLTEVESSKVQKVDAMYSAAMETLHASQLHNSDGVQQSSLQKIIEEYFNSGTCDNASIMHMVQDKSVFLHADIKVFLQSNLDSNFTPRAVARIMHGLSSPGYPSSIWSKNHFWGRYWKIDFNVVKKAAALEMMMLKSKNSHFRVSSSV